MPKDYAGKQKQTLWGKKSPKRNNKHFPWLLIILVIILVAGLISGLFYVVHYVKSRADQAALQVKNNKTSLSEAQAANRYTKLKAIQTPVRFEFYNMLPKMNVNVSSDNVTTGLAEKKTLAIEQCKKIILQLGSKSSPDEFQDILDQLKKQGFSSSIVTISKGQVVWYRLQMGPYHSLEKAQTIQAQLDQKHISSIIECL